MARRRWAVLGAALLGVMSASPATAGGAGGGGGGGVCPGFGSGAVIELRDNCFAPTAQLSGSGEVTVRNTGRLVHDLTAVDASVTTGPMSPGQEVKLSIDRRGPVRVFCTLHGTAGGKGMAGVLLLDGEAGSVVPLASSDGGSGIGVLVAVAAAAAAGTLVVRRRRAVR